MLNKTFYLDGVSAESVGIYLQEPIKFTKAEPIYETQTIPGRNGTLTRFTGAYKNRTGKASCFCLQENVETAITNVGRFLTQETGYRRLETPDDPDHYWLARVCNSPDIDIRNGVLAPFDISFDCKPQRFLKSGENPIAISTTGKTVVNNPYGQMARPLIKVTEAAGGGWFTVGDWNISIRSGAADFMYVDCETMNAYNDDGDMSKFVSSIRNVENGTFYDYPVLLPGETTVYYRANIDADSPTSVEIIPRWWEI